MFIYSNNNTNIITTKTTRYIRFSQIEKIINNCYSLHDKIYRLLN